MYYIMKVTSKRDNYCSLYQFMTNTTTAADGSTVTELYEIEDKAALDRKIEKMLNVEGYAKSDFIVVQQIDYTIDAKDYTDDTESTDNTGTDTTGGDTSGDSGDSGDNSGNQSGDSGDGSTNP